MGSKIINLILELKEVRKTLNDLELAPKKSIQSARIKATNQIREKQIMSYMLKYGCNGSLKLSYGSAKNANNILFDYKVFFLDLDDEEITLLLPIRLKAEIISIKIIPVSLGKALKFNF